MGSDELLKLFIKDPFCMYSLWHNNVIESGWCSHQKKDALADEGEQRYNLGYNLRHEIKPKRDF